MQKKNKTLILSSILSVALVATPAITSNVNSTILNDAINNALGQQNNSDTSKSQTVVNDVTQSKPVVPSEFFYQMPIISVDTGPIVYYGSKITSLDWFGAERWSIDFADQNKYAQYFPGTKDNIFVEWPYGAFTNWAIDKKNNVLWILTNSKHTTSDKRANNVPPQNILKIDTISGNILGKYSLPGFKQDQVIAGQYNLYYQIQLLDSGKLVIFSQGSDLWGYNWVFDPNEKDPNKQFVFSDAKTFPQNQIITDISKGKNEASAWSRYIVPITNNVNILVVVDRSSVNSDLSKATGDLFMFLVDDNFRRIPITDSNSPWYNGYRIQNIWTYQTEGGWSYRYGDKFSKAFFKTVNGRTYFTAYDKFFVFYPNFKEGYGVHLSEFTFDNKRAVSSYTIDPSENLFYKLVDDNKIYKLEITGTSYENTKFNSYSYYDLSGNVETSIKDHAKNFVIFNVPGYSGSIMMINSKIIPNAAHKKNITDTGEQDKIKAEGYGISVAVVENANNAGTGDSKGLLNTDKAFIKSSDFTINPNVLSNKLPSEINRNDLTISNNGFFTNNPTKDEHGNIKYPQFKKTVMEDNDNSKDNLTITANIDQIPWFVNNGIMPGNIPPLTITKQFRTGQNIQQRITWKDASLDYDFKNTLPSKLNVSDVQRFDPFDINLTSQQTSVSGIKYPQKSYQIVNHNDENGQVTIRTTLKYLPIDVEAKAENVIQQTFDHTYSIFKKNDNKNFNFVGNNNPNEDIKAIPQLKELSQSNLLPSSFNAQDIASILKFINTDTSSGYPISKMEFQVSADDTQGTLTISGRLPDGYYEGQNNQTFSKTYTGLNKVSDYSLFVNQNPSSFNKKQYRPSEIDEQVLYENFINYNGFNSSDIELQLTPNDETGQLNIKLVLDGNYPSSVTTAWSFTKENDSYVKNESISGFKTTEEYENQYVVKFKDDNSQSLRELKKYTPNQIKDILSKSGSDNRLTIDGIPINNELDLAKNVIESKGSSIPNNWDTAHFAHEIYYNDTNGEITVKLTFKVVPGTSEDLVFIQRYTGFAKGNQVSTDDIFSFKTQSQLFADDAKLREILPTDIEKQLKDATNGKTMLKKFIGFSSDAYTRGIDENKYSLEVIADDIYGYITLKITFESTVVTDQNSLLSYTVTYNGFITE